MTTTAEWYELEGTSTDDFELSRLMIVGESDTAAIIGAFLLEGLTDTEHLAALMEKHGFEGIRDYVRERRIPSRLNIRVADFGEVTAGRLLESEEDLLRPIEKLRYKFNHEWSPHLTDVFALRIQDDEITAFAYCEVKAGTTTPDLGVGSSAYKELLKTWQAEMPEILHFTSERLWEAGRITDWERLDRAMYDETPVGQLLRLVLVFDDVAWSEGVLDRVRDAIAEEAAPDDTFACYLVRRSELRDLINESFEEMASLAVQL